MSDGEFDQTPDNSDTFDDQNTSAPQDGESYADDSNIDQSGTAPADSTGSNADDSEAIAKKREAGKFSKVERENYELNQRNEALSKLLTSDPVIYERALKKAGMSDSEVDQRVRAQFPDYGKESNDNQNANQNQKPTFDYNSLPDDVKDDLSYARSLRTEKNKSRQDAAQQFWKNHSDIDSTTAQVVAMEAFRLETSYGLKPSEALERAGRKILSEDEIKKEGYTEGLGRGLSSTGAQHGGSGSSNPIKSSRNANFSSEDIQVINALGLNTEEGRKEYLQNKNAS